jgi:hypothetical protein
LSAPARSGIERLKFAQSAANQSLMGHFLDSSPKLLPFRAIIIVEVGAPAGRRGSVRNCSAAGDPHAGEPTHLISRSRLRTLNGRPVLGCDGGELNGRDGRKAAEITNFRSDIPGNAGGRRLGDRRRADWAADNILRYPDQRWAPSTAAYSNSRKR